MARNNISRILDAPNKEIGRTHGPNGVLSRLFRTILVDLGIGISRWNALMVDYITDPRNGVPPNTRDQTSARGNLAKELLREQMTWKVFIKGLKFLKITKIEFSISATHANGKKTIHSTEVDFGSRNPSVRDRFEQAEGADDDGE